MSNRLTDKVVLITGAASGIGLATARHLAAQGTKLILLDMNVSGLAAVEAHIRQTYDTAVEIFGCDIADEVAVSQAYEAGREAFGYIDGIVSCAGMMIYKPLADISAAEWQRLMSVNFFAATGLTRLAFGTMHKGGSLVFVSSIHARQTSSLVGPYAAAKAALTSLARTASIEGKSRGIRANCILPGAIDTPMLHASPNIASGIEVIDPADIGQPADIAEVAAFLLSDAATFVTGTEIIADGGRLAKL